MSRSDVLVDAEWLEANRGDACLVIVEVDEDTSPYDKGQIRGARKVDWYSGLQAPPQLTQEQAQRGGDIPTAKNVPWCKAAEEDGTFKSDDALRALYGDEAGLDFGKDTIAYCRIGERSAHTWFVLHELLGQA